MVFLFTKHASYKSCPGLNIQFWNGIRNYRITVAEARVDKICITDVGVLYDIIPSKNARALQIKGFGQQRVQHNPHTASYTYIESGNPD